MQRSWTGESLSQSLSDGSARHNLLDPRESNQLRRTIGREGAAVPVGRWDVRGEGVAGLVPQLIGNAKLLGQPFAGELPIAVDASA